MYVFTNVSYRFRSTTVLVIMPLHSAPICHGILMTLVIVVNNQTYLSRPLNFGQQGIATIIIREKLEQSSCLH